MSVIEKARPGGREPAGGVERSPRRGRRSVGVVVGVFVAAALAAFGWMQLRTPAEAPLAAPAEEPLGAPPPLGATDPLAAPAVPPAPEADAAREPAADVAPAPSAALPPREDSDPLARDLARPLSSHPLFRATLKESGVIDRFVLVVDNLAEGNVPRRELGYLRPQGRFLVLGAESDGQRMDPASYPRYDALAAAIASLDADSAVAAYRQVAPLCEESYRALGYPEGGFEQRLRAALALLLSTPVLDEDPAVVPETKRWEFADPALESLSDAQKQLLRMGPANAKRVQAKLREIQAALVQAR